MSLNQSQLSTITASFLPSPNFKNLPKDFFSPSMLCASVSSLKKGRSLSLPEGSPMRAVAPPTSVSGLWPHFWNQRIIISGTMCPTCRLSPVGSEPR